MIVLDASAAINIARETPEGQGLAVLMVDGEECIAPSLFFAEAANVVWQYDRADALEGREPNELMQTILDLVDDFVGIADMWPEALSEARRFQHPVYDLFYFILARRNAATLFTLDRKLQELCLDAGVNCVYTDTEF